MTQNKPDTEVTCEVCYYDVELKDMVQMTDCGHMLCEDCFQAYCQSKVLAGADAVYALCPD